MPSKRRQTQKPAYHMTSFKLHSRKGKNIGTNSSLLVVVRHWGWILGGNGSALYLDYGGSYMTV